MGNVGLQTLIFLTFFLVIQADFVRWNAKRPADSIFLIYYELSFKECSEACFRFRTCAVFDYNRRLMKCRLSHRHESTNHRSYPVTGSIIANKPSKMYGDLNPDPVFDPSELPGCHKFYRNIDDVTIECRTQGKGKKIYVKQSNGRITNHLTVFRAFNGDGTNTYDSWVHRENVTLLKTCTSPKSCDKHFRHLIVDELGTEYVKQVKFLLKKGEREVAFILFEGQGHDLESWFNKDGIINSSWTGLKAIRRFQWFSIKGDDPNRQFLICVKYGGCPNDKMVTFASTNDPDICPFDTLTKSPQLSYCKNVMPCTGNDMKIADTLEIEWYY